MNKKSQVWNQGKLKTLPPKGFTLIELLVVIAIIGVLTGIIAVNFVGVRERTRDAQRKSDLSQIQRPLQAYFEDHGKFPISSADFKINKDGDTVVSWGESWDPYMPRVPKDPKSPSQDYCYESAADGSWYRLCAKLEHCPDSQTIPTVDCATAPYNYSITSSNIPVAPCGCGQAP